MEKLKIKIKRVDKSLPLPEYKTNGSVAMDVAAREKTVIPPKEIRYIPLNVIIKVPPNYWVMMAPRSSVHKLGILQVNSIGVFDQDFCGEKDEYKFAAFNYTDKEVVVEKGMRIAQLIVMNFHPLELEEVDSVSEESRGGFGSTGTK